MFPTPAAAMDLEAILRDMASVVQAPKFNAWRRAFIDEHVDEFVYGEENKLVYTETHERFCAHVEADVATALPPGVSMEDFMVALQTEMQAGGGKLSGEAVTVLIEAGDFVAFKEMMLFEKCRRDDPAAPAAASGGALQHSSGVTVPQIDAMMNLCAELQSAADSNDGWVNVLTNAWMRIDKQPVPPEVRASPSEIYMRGVWTLDLSFVEACDMMFSFDDRRMTWDMNMKKITPIRGDPLVDDDVVVTAHLDFGMLLHMAGVPKTLTSRSILRWNFPTNGVVTYAVVPWDAAKDCYDDGSILKIKAGTLAPHPQSPSNKCVMTTLETNKFGGAPKWVLSGLLNFTAPQIMRGLEQRYIKKIRETGTTRDIVRCRCKR
ncbi:hypothetical protein KFE25_010905 [Diacronema lutheri]|uniref:ADP-ribosylation factor-like protein 2-binding protein n=1 Tax=Diacronema lutheri TaxID=2081491 RepID=A0A8J6C8R2_DIALT|nr:hypothetical protein KFE25_010905 [Diacronema lutheri]